MNRSGEAVSALRSATSLDPTTDLLVLVDDLALPRSTFRLRSRGSAGGHNGLVSVEQALGTQHYARLRIGIGPPPDDGDDQAEFVTAPFEPTELSELAELLPSLVDAVECWVEEGIVTAMNRFNRRIGAEGEDREDGQEVR
jgi:PTH1 family peptidyl-tRNA hydrolase